MPPPGRIPIRSAPPGEGSFASGRPTPRLRTADPFPDPFPGPRRRASARDAAPPGGRPGRTSFFRGRLRPVCVALAAAIAGMLAVPAKGGTMSISVSSVAPATGDPLVVEVAAGGSIDNLVLRWKGAGWPMREVAPGRYEGVIGVDLDDPEGPLPLVAEGSAGGERVRAETAVNVVSKGFLVEKLTLPAKMAQFDDAALRRIEAETSDLSRRFSVVTPPRWRRPFLPPVEEYRPGNFGSRREINGEPRAPHAGVDIRLPEGTPVRSIADGRVAFAGERFFGGKSVVIDHGGGVFSVYYHLSAIFVEEGAGVARGERIGSVGATGRATGSHLHFGVRVPGGRVDPTLLLALPGR